MSQSTLVTADELVGSVLAGAGLKIRHAVFTDVPKGTRFGPRCGNDHILWCLRRGRIAGRVAEREVTLPAGRLHWLSPNVPDAFEVIEPGTRTYSIRFHLERADGRLPRLQADHQLLPATGRIVDLCERLCRLSGGGGGKALRAVLTRAMLGQLLGEAARLGAAGTETDVEALTPRQVADLYRYLDEHLADPPAPGDFAGILHLSQDYFGRKFRRHFTMPPRRWIRRERLGRAAAMLTETHLTVQQIAAAVGYNDGRFFAKQFKSEFGRTPTTYRREAR